MGVCALKEAKSRQNAFFAPKTRPFPLARVEFAEFRPFSRGNRQENDVLPICAHYFFPRFQSNHSFDIYLLFKKHRVYGCTVIARTPFCVSDSRYRAPFTLTPSFHSVCKQSFLLQAIIPLASHRSSCKPSFLLQAIIPLANHHSFRKPSFLSQAIIPFASHHSSRKLLFIQPLVACHTPLFPSDLRAICTAYSSDATM